MNQNEPRKAVRAGGRPYLRWPWRSPWQALWAGRRGGWWRTSAAGALHEAGATVNTAQTEALRNHPPPLPPWVQFNIRRSRGHPGPNSQTTPQPVCPPFSNRPPRREMLGPYNERPDFRGGGRGAPRGHEAGRQHSARPHAGWAQGRSRGEGSARLATPGHREAGRRRKGAEGSTRPAGEASGAGVRTSVGGGTEAWHSRPGKDGQRRGQCAALPCPAPPCFLNSSCGGDSGGPGTRCTLSPSLPVPPPRRNPAACAAGLGSNCRGSPQTRPARPTPRPGPPPAQGRRDVLSWSGDGECGQEEGTHHLPEDHPSQGQSGPHSQRLFQRRRKLHHKVTHTSFQEPTA